MFEQLSVGEPGLEDMKIDCHGTTMHYHTTFTWNMSPHCQRKQGSQFQSGCLSSKPPLQGANSDKFEEESEADVDLELAEMTKTLCAVHGGHCDIKMYAEILHDFPANPLAS